MRRVTRGFITALGIGFAVPAVTVHAQAATPFDTAYVRTATLGQLLVSARVGDSIANTQSTFAAGHAIFQRLRERLGRPDIQDIKLKVVADSRVDFKTVLRKQPPTALSISEAAALDTLARAMQQLYPRILTPMVGADSASRLLDPVVALQSALRQNSMLQSREKLNRFERKYGPGSPSRNIAEVLLNFGAQWVPAFQPDDDGWPSRFEIIASYVPTYLRVPVNGGESGAVTVAELGTRAFIWRPGWGGKSGGVLRPAYVSFGAVVAGEQDGAMTSPFKGASRFGAFVGWGDAKVAVIGGRNTRVLITRKFHVVPWAF